MHSAWRCVVTSRWVDASVMLVEALTKDMSGNQLRSCIKTAAPGA